MKLQFSNTSDNNGIVQLIERDTETTSATGSSYPLKVKTVDINEALGWFSLLAIKYSGRWQFDDTNQTNFPILRTDVVSAQNNYTFLYDSSTVPNEIMDLHLVRIKDTNGNWKELTPIDRREGDITKWEGVSGVPEQYDITADSIILYPSPNYNSTEGLEIYISRTPSFFLSTDTTKTAGIPAIFHDYLRIRPSYRYCMRKQLKNADGLKEEMTAYEDMIKDYYSERIRVERPRARFNVENTR